MAPAHVCHQEGRLSKIEAEIVHQAEQDNSIRSDLKNIVTAVQKNHDSQQSFEVTVAKSFGKLETILSEQSERLKESKQTQDEIKSGLEKLGQRVNDIEHDVKKNSEDIIDVKKTNESYDSRLRKVEKYAIYVMAVIAVLTIIIQAISSFDSIKYKLFPELNNVTKQEGTSK